MIIRFWADLCLSAAISESHFNSMYICNLIGYDFIHNIQNFLKTTIDLLISKWFVYRL